VKKEETKPRDYSECDPAPESQTPQCRLEGNISISKVPFLINRIEIKI